MSDVYLLIGSVTIGGLLAYKLYNNKHTNELGLPPSPKAYPLIGHLLSVPTKHEHLEFMKLGEHIGSKIFSLTVFGTTIIVLNDKDDVVNLFEKRSAIYSDRTCACIVKDPTLFNWETFGSLIGYGDQWRRYRRLMTPWLTKKASAVHHRYQEQETRKLLQRIIRNPNVNKSSHEVEGDVLLASSRISFKSFYGFETDSSSDLLAARTQKLISYLASASLNSNHLVNTIPVLRHVPEWFPGAAWKREVLKWRKEKETLLDELYNVGLEKMKTEENTYTMIKSFRSDALKLGLSEEEADDHTKQLLITLVGASIETTVSTLMMFLLAMVLFPEVQKRAQEELESVVGSARLPTFDDQTQLGYIERIVQEVLRWAPVTGVGKYGQHGLKPIGVDGEVSQKLAIPHTCYQDDTYKGYYIPKGAIMVGNVWAITRDETIYKNPEVFEPDRFLDPSVPASPAFGWGRRRCPGRHFAHSSLFIMIASILAAFNIEAAQDKDGKDILPSGKMINSIVLSPEHFMLKLTPRSAKHEELIQRDF